QTARGVRLRLVPPPGTGLAGPVAFLSKVSGRRPSAHKKPGAGDGCDRESAQANRGHRQLSPRGAYGARAKLPSAGPAESRGQKLVSVASVGLETIMRGAISCTSMHSLCVAG